MKYNYNKAKPYLGLSFLVILLFVGFNFRPVTKRSLVGDDKITWMTIEQAEEACKKKPRKIMIDVYTSWCGWCKKMDATTFTDPTVMKYMNEKYYAVKLDAEDRNNIIFKEKVHKFNEQRKTHDLAIAMLNGNMSYPTTVYLDEKLNVIQPIDGYLDAREFNKVIHYFGENGYRKKTFEEYKRDFKEAE